MQLLFNWGSDLTTASEAFRSSITMYCHHVAWTETRGYNHQHAVATVYPILLYAKHWAVDIWDRCTRLKELITHSGLIISNQY